MLPESFLSQKMSFIKKKSFVKKKVICKEKSGAVTKVRLVTKIKKLRKLSFILELKHQHHIVIVEITHKIRTSFKTMTPKKAAT